MMTTADGKGSEEEGRRELVTEKGPWVDSSLCRKMQTEGKAQQSVARCLYIHSYIHVRIYTVHTHTHTLRLSPVSWLQEPWAAETRSIPSYIYNLQIELRSLASTYVRIFGYMLYIRMVVCTHTHTRMIIDNVYTTWKETVQRSFIFFTQKFVSS